MYGFHFIFCFKIRVWGMILLSPSAYSDTGVRPIPPGVRTGGSWITGGSFHNVPGTICTLKIPLPDASFSHISPEGDSCPGYGCNHCTAGDCMYADFIRRYWIFPRSG